MKIISKVFKALTKPGKFFRLCKTFFQISKRTNIGVAIGYIREEHFGENTYMKKRESKNKGTLVKVELDDSSKTTLFVDLRDKGISKDLIIHGKREEEISKEFKKYLKESQTIIDAGSNIGYYVIMESQVIGNHGKIYAIEPDPSNFGILRKNVEYNGFTEIVDLERAALSDNTGESILYLANRSNLHTLTKTKSMEKYVEFEGQITVPTYTLDDFVEYKGIAPGEIDIIRMDIEGHEFYALQGMKRTIEKSGNLVFFIEIHPKLMKDISAEAYPSFLKMLKDMGFEIKDSAMSLSSQKDKKVHISNIDDLADFHEAVEVILEKR
ncbi:hypothetical protein DRQ36_06005 [bacterium]|nr:MAG: hypothetical protein DRQ36_06005 [bacterium]